MRKIVKIPSILLGVYLLIGFILFVFGGFKHPEIIFYYGYIWFMLFLLIVRCWLLNDFLGACDISGF